MVATFSQHQHPTHRPFPGLALEVSHLSCRCETLNCAAELFATAPLVPCHNVGRWPVDEVIDLNKTLREKEVAAGFSPDKAETTSHERGIIIWIKLHPHLSAALEFYHCSVSPFLS